MRATAYVHALLVPTLLAASVAGAAVAHAQARCLSPQEQRQALHSERLVPLAGIVRQVARSGEVVRAQLCEAEGGGHVYVLTVLRGDGKVVRQSFDASTGAPIASK